VFVDEVLVVYDVWCGLDAIQTNAGTPVLQLHDLQGNIVATVKDNEAETKLASTYNSTEFGVPQSGTTPPKYAWLGADGLATELSSGAATKGGASYVPQVARNLQTAPVVPPGAFPNGQGTGSQYESEIPGWYISLSSAESAETVIEYAAKQAALKKKAEEEALERQHDREEYPEPIPSPEEGGANEASSICEVAFVTDQDAEGCPAIEELSETESGSLNAHAASVLGVAEEIGKELGHGVNAAAKFMGRNAARFADILSNLSTMASTALGGIMVGTYAGEACIVGAGAGPVAPLVWIGCGPFFAGAPGI
jgi:hypothetical protein